MPSVEPSRTRARADHEVLVLLHQVFLSCGNETVDGTSAQEAVDAHDEYGDIREWQTHEAVVRCAEGVGRMMRASSDETKSAQLLLLSASYAPPSLLHALSSLHSPELHSSATDPFTRQQVSLQLNLNRFRLALSTHALVALLGIHSLDFLARSVFANVLPPSLAPLPTLQGIQAVSLSHPIPSYSLASDSRLLHQLNTSSHLKPINRALVALAGPTGTDLHNLISFSLNDARASASADRSLYWLVVVGTFHLYKGKLDSWLASIFPRLKHATNNTSNAFASAASLAAAASTPIPAMPATLSSPLHTSFAQSPSTSRVNSNQSSVTPASTTRRLTPTLLDVETFVLLCITINYIKCVQEGGADTLNRILFFTMAQRCWSPSAGLLSFWNSLLTGYAEYEVPVEIRADPSLTFPVPLNAVALTRYLKDLRSLGAGTLDLSSRPALRAAGLHVGAIYSRFAVEGVQDCGALAKAMLDGLLARKDTGSVKDECAAAGLMEELSVALEGVDVVAWIGGLEETCCEYQGLLAARGPVSPERVITSPRKVPASAIGQESPTDPLSPSLRAGNLFGLSLFSPAKELTKAATTGVGASPARKQDVRGSSSLRGSPGKSLSPKRDLGTGTTPPIRPATPLVASVGLVALPPPAFAVSPVLGQAGATVFGGVGVSVGASAAEDEAGLPPLLDLAELLVREGANGERLRLRRDENDRAFRAFSADLRRGSGGIGARAFGGGVGVGGGPAMGMLLEGTSVNDSDRDVLSGAEMKSLEELRIWKFMEGGGRTGKDWMQDRLLEIPVPEVRVSGDDSWAEFGDEVEDAGYGEGESFSLDLDGDKLGATSRKDRLLAKLSQKDV